MNDLKLYAVNALTMAVSFTEVEKQSKDRLTFSKYSLYYIQNN